MIKPTILIVDDNTKSLALFKLHLEKIGLTIENATNGVDAMIKFQRLTPDIVITNLVLPKLDGLTLVKLIKGLNPCCEVIVFTAKRSIKMAVAAMKAGAFDFLLKPVEPKYLETVVRYCLRDLELKKKMRSGCDQNEDITNLSPDTIKTMYTRLRKMEIEEEFKGHALTPREVTVAELVLMGRTDQEASNTLCISLHTAKKHVQNIFRKVGVQSRIELISKFQ